MLLKTVTSLAFATACLSVVAAMPAYAATNSSNWSARQNVIESHRYDRLLETNRKFREARMRRECGPITDPQLHQACLASFSQDEPYSGSSMPRHRSYQSGSGR